MRSPLPTTYCGSDTLGAWLRVHLIYLWRHHRLAKIANPDLLTEHIQRRKLSDRDPRMPLYADKVAVKDVVRERLGEQWLTPTLWHGDVLPADPAWPTPFMVKSRHGCGHFAIVRDPVRDYPKALKASRQWMRSRYGRWLDEWLYGEIRQGLLVEPFFGDGGVLPIDYKLFVFGGRVRYVQVHLDRATRHRWVVMNLEWERVSPDSEDLDPARPATLQRMIAAAEKLAEDFPFVRVDFYEIAGQPRFGELTFYPGSGLEPVEPLSLDQQMGRLWSAALVLAQQVAENGIGA